MTHNVTRWVLTLTDQQASFTAAVHFTRSNIRTFAPHLSIGTAHSVLIGEWPKIAALRKILMPPFVTENNTRNNGC